MRTLAMVPFGLLNGTLVEARSVLNGKKCGCVCPGCGRPLIAYNRSELRRTPHFGHQPGEDCPTAFESALHLAAKQVLLCEKRMTVPALVVDTDGILVGPRGIFHLQTVLEEPSLAEYEFVDAEVSYTVAPRPKPSLAQSELFAHSILEKSPAPKLFRADICAQRRYDADWIEIRVFHAVDANKQMLMQQAGLRAIEVDLRRLLKQAVSLEDVRRAILNELSGKTWLSHPKVEGARAKLVANYERETERYLAQSQEAPTPRFEDRPLPTHWREPPKYDPFLPPLEKDFRDRRR